jgi:glycosyltransferase involved in cell wall biosynthesis
VRLNVLVVDRSPPVSTVQGNALIGVELFRRLRHHRLTLVAPVLVEDREASLRQTEGIFEAAHLVVRDARIPALGGLLEARAHHRLPMLPGLELDAARRFASTLRRVASSEQFDVVHVRQLPMAPYGKEVGGGRLLELIDSETLGAERARPRTVRTQLRAKIAAPMERLAMRGYHVVTAVAAADADRLRNLAPNQRIEVVPNGVDAGRFRPLATIDRDGCLLVFVGVMSYPPNIAAMRHFCLDVLPVLRRSRPELRLEIVGRDPTGSVRELSSIDGVHVTGEVPDVVPYLARATLFVAPMISGSGIKNKVLEAMAAETPVVVSSLAVEGLPVVSGREVVIADGVSDMAAAIERLLASEAERDALGRAARAFVERRFSWDACASTYDRLYADLARRAGPSA